MGEIFRSNLIDEKVRYHLLSNTSKDAGFTELRVEAQKFVNRIGVGAEVNTSGECYRIESKSDKLKQEMLDLRREVERYRAGFAQQLITEYKSIFHVNGQSIGLSVGTHMIRTIDDVPVAQPYRRIDRALVGKVKSKIDEWIEEGVIVRSLSEYASPLVVVSKGEDDIRLCVDYRDRYKITGCRGLERVNGRNI